ncbi:RibD family protein [Leptothoe sp. PORK10 BA2]|uniref:RibD family protein n=1 Tax=Leptothoe sp. PORK10 BA2 TaxID=3110254 RepID=UPI002B213D61|nr:RibD family protein [Leptothoe sp. PORK10 BA2]MEA5463228.1 RibD family protein [Leptothoe sp. PORK10 BA2]
MSAPALRSRSAAGYRPHVTAILAMSADGKISDTHGTAARFPSANDQRHLEQRLATADATLFGAGTLRAYGTTALVKDPALLATRCQRQQPPQPTHIVCSRSGGIVPNAHFFRQPVPRWLLTTQAGAEHWREQPGFDRVWIAPIKTAGEYHWPQILQELHTLGMGHVLVMGGGQLVAGLMAADVIDELWLTICPLIIGGATSPTPCDGEGFSLDQAPRFTLKSSQTMGDEIFLNYQRQGSGPSVQ